MLNPTYNDRDASSTATLLVSVGDAKSYLGILGDTSDDALIEQFLRSATDQVSAYLSESVAAAENRDYFSGFDYAMELSQNIRGITPVVSYLNEANSEVTISDGFQVDHRGERTRIMFDVLPDVQLSNWRNPVKVTYSYGSGLVSKYSAMITNAIKHLVRVFYYERSDQLPGARKIIAGDLSTIRRNYEGSAG